MVNSKYFEGAKSLVDSCIDEKSVKNICIIFDPETKSVAEYFIEVFRLKNFNYNPLEIPSLSIHGQEPPWTAAELMLSSDHILGLTQYSMAHTLARKRATENGARYLSLPDYSLELLKRPSMQFDFRKIRSKCEELKAKIDVSTEIEVTTPLGTSLKFNTGGRRANSCPGSVLNPGELGSPPDSEVNIAPLEESSDGIIYVDGSIPCKEIGKLDSPVKLLIEGGFIKKIEGDPKYTLPLEKFFFKTKLKNTNLLAEFGIGLNRLASLCGIMLEDEGCANTIHFGFGSNSTIGGLNSTPFHLDFVICEPSVYLDGQKLNY